MLVKGAPVVWFNIKMPSCQYRKSHCGDKTILQPSYLHNGISCTGEMTYQYWIRPLVSSKPVNGPVWRIIIHHNQRHYHSGCQPHLQVSMPQCHCHSGRMGTHQPQRFDPLPSQWTGTLYWKFKILFLFLATTAIGTDRYCHHSACLSVHLSQMVFLLSQFLCLKELWHFLW